MTNAAPNPFTPEQQAELRAATNRAAKVRRACTIAKFDAWMTALFAAFTLMAVPFSPSALFIGIPLAAVAFNAFAGEKLLRAFDLRGPRRLGVNQILFMAVIFAYCIWQIIATFMIGDILEQYPQLAQLETAYNLDIDNLTQWVRTIAVLTYGAIIFASVLTQGLMAWYYFSREKFVRAYIVDTPSWVIDVQRSVG